MNASKKKVTELWEFSRNLLVKPNLVKVTKDCPKTYWLDRTCDKRVIKNEEYNSKTTPCIGYTEYCLYFLTEVSAWDAFNNMRAAQRERELKSTDKYKKNKFITEFSTQLKKFFEEEDFEQLCEDGSCYLEDITTAIDTFTNLYLEDKDVPEV